MIEWSKSKKLTDDSLGDPSVGASSQSTRNITGTCEESQVMCPHQRVIPMLGRPDVSQNGVKLIKFEFPSDSYLLSL